MTDDTVATQGRGEPGTRTLPNGDNVHESSDGRFVFSPNTRTVHQREEWPTDEYDYAFHPKCGQRLPEGSIWGSVDAESEEEAVMKYDLSPCTRCITESRKLKLWRKDAYTAHVMHRVDTPDRWL